MALITSAERLERFATDLAVEGLAVHKATASLDESQDGEPVTRVTLLVNDPQRGESTWNFEGVRELKRQISLKAIELDLPAASVTLIPDSEAGLVDSFAS